jgi:hypothetical protein
MRVILTTLLLAAGVVGANAQQTCDDFKDSLDAALRTVKLNVDLTYKVSDQTATTEYLEGLGDARIAIGCGKGVLSQFSGTSYEKDQRAFHKLSQAVLIAMGVEKSPRKAETIANRVRAAALKADVSMKWEEISGFTIEVTHYPGSGGEQFRVDPPKR